jgi:formylglycine-generating enzyme required for sulfatase activity
MSLRGSALVDIFISHDRADEALARKISQQLEARGFTSWPGSETVLAELHHDNLQTELEQAQLIVAIWSRRSCENQWVRLEAGFAASRGKLLQLVRPPARVPEEFADAPFIRAGGAKGPNIDQILAHLTQGHPRSAKAKPQKPKVQEERPPESKAPGRKAPARSYRRARVRGKRGTWPPFGFGPGRSQPVIVLAGLTIFAILSWAAFQSLDGRAHWHALRNAIAGRVPVQEPMEAFSAGLRHDHESVAGTQGGRDPLPDAPQALRQLLQKTGDGALAARITQRLVQKEHDAWIAAEQAGDALVQYQKLNIYRQEFPDGVYKSRADLNLEAIEERLLNVWSALAERGHIHGGFSPERLETLITGAEFWLEARGDETPIDDFDRWSAAILAEVAPLEGLRADAASPASLTEQATSFIDRAAELRAVDRFAGLMNETSEREEAGAPPHEALNAHSATLSARDPMVVEDSGRIRLPERGTGAGQGAGGADTRPMPVSSPVSSTWSTERATGTVFGELQAPKPQPAAHISSSEAGSSDALMAPGGTSPEEPRSGEPSGGLKDCPQCPALIRLKPDEYVMGDGTGRGAHDERPLRKITFRRSFYLGVTEVTFAQWDACHAASACRHRPDDAGFGRGSRPVINVNIQDIEEYLGWLSAKTGERYRLPSEAEWEYAARARSGDDYSFGNDVSLLCRYANGADNSSTYSWANRSCSDGFGDGTAPVGSLMPNGFGFYDMMGNVWEWVADCWHSSYEGHPRSGSAWTSDCDSQARILRGGSYSVQADYLRVSYRYNYDPEERLPFFGFRVARDG